MGWGKTGKRECVSVLDTICCVPGNKGVSAGAELPSPRSGALRVAEVYMACICEMQRQQLWPPLYSVQCEAGSPSARNGERCQG